eukprot:TRINITY_DN4930_c0_g1_i2.p1 TRINITY_DN4930_c0_g1~~TRINITY_DN4930_c0_g1_i2.p1  ORF type:complete len:342 (+),score=40.35 TRINITY_DN4930_c0_g1_i2:137-1162(+)
MLAVKNKINFSILNQRKEFSVAMEPEKFEITLRTIDDIKKHLQDIQTKRTIDNNSLEQEFNIIEDYTRTSDFNRVYDFTSARKAENRIKNRYTNILPIESTRVKLLDGQDGDYVNANYINGEVENSENAYIAAQGPLEETCTDFWRMIWHEKANVIVMLTKRSENDRSKCYRYWPKLNTTFLFSYLQVTTSHKEVQEVTIRRFVLENIHTKEVRKVVQFQYREWPDHGLPESTHPFRQLLEDVDLEHDKKGPIVVHCSAGIGRTGTFCTVHSNLKKARQLIRRNQDITINVFKSILRLRSERSGMVQTKDQYIFCYLVILEELLQLFEPNQKNNGMAPSKV